MLRPYLSIGLFALAALAAACGGGGGASTPGLPAAPHAGSTPLSYTKAAMTLKIPPQPKAGGIKRAAFVSPNTQSVQVLVLPLASVAPSASPSPPAVQIFPVTTPSPCSQAADGSKTCTFNVAAPIGQDAFVILTYAEPSPGPTAIPLAIFESGAVDVSLTGTPPPLNFTLSGVVSSVDVAMASPQPSFTPSTQIATAGVAFSPMPLALTPRDQSGSPILTDAFVSPVTLTVNPTNAGVSLALAAPSQCSPASSASGSTASITCAKDINDITYAYDGTIAYDTTPSVLDHILISAQPQINPSAASGGFVALAGNIVSYSLPSAGLSGSNPVVSTEHQNDGTIRYVDAVYANGTALGAFDPSNPAAGHAVMLPYYGPSFASDTFGNIWVADHTALNNATDSALQCYTGISTTPAATVPLWFTVNSIAITPFSVARDGNGNIWYFGQDTSTYTNQAGYLTVGPNCTVTSQSTPIQIGSPSDYPQAVRSDQTTGSVSGVFLLSNSTGNIYHATTTTASAVSTPVVSPGSFYGQGLAIDAVGNLYASLYNVGSGSSVIDQLPSGGSAADIATLSPISSPGGLDIFPWDIGYPAHIAYAESGGIGIFDPTLPYSPNNLQVLPFGAYASVAAFFDSNGDPWLIYADQTGGAHVAHVIRTSVWAAVSPGSATVYGSATTQTIGIMETGDSGPFTVTNISDTTVATPATPWPGIDHDVVLNMSGSTSTGLSVTISDSHGRTQVVTFPVALGALARRHSAKIPCIRSHRVDSGQPPC